MNTPHPHEGKKENNKEQLEILRQALREAGEAVSNARKVLSQPPFQKAPPRIAELDTLPGILKKLAPEQQMQLTRQLGQLTELMKGKTRELQLLLRAWQYKKDGQNVLETRLLQKAEKKRQFETRNALAKEPLLFASDAERNEADDQEKRRQETIAEIAETVEELQRELENHIAMVQAAEAKLKTPEQDLRSSILPLQELFRTMLREVTEQRRTAQPAAASNPSVRKTQKAPASREGTSPKPKAPRPSMPPAFSKPPTVVPFLHLADLNISPEELASCKNLVSRYVQGGLFPRIDVDLYIGRLFGRIEDDIRAQPANNPLVTRKILLEKMRRVIQKSSAALHKTDDKRERALIGAQTIGIAHAYQGIKNPNGLPAKLTVTACLPPMHALSRNEQIGYEELLRQLCRQDVPIIGTAATPSSLLPSELMRQTALETRDLVHPHADQLAHYLTEFTKLTAKRDGETDLRKIAKAIGQILLSYVQPGVDLVENKTREFLRTMDPKDAASVLLEGMMQTSAAIQGQPTISQRGILAHRTLVTATEVLKQLDEWERMTRE